MVVAQYLLSRVLSLSVTWSVWLPDHFRCPTLQFADLGPYARSWRHLDLLGATRTPLGGNHLAVTAAAAAINHWGLVAVRCEAAAPRCLARYSVDLSATAALLTRRLPLITRQLVQIVLA